jgi:hypothetical protein
MKKILSFIIFIILLFDFHQAKADGMMLSFDDLMGTYDLYETNQTAIIVYDSGREDLYIKVNYDGSSKDFAWIIPTPSKPEPSESSDAIFDELYRVSKPIIKDERALDLRSSLGSFGGGDVEVYKEGVIGIYDFSILSAKGGNGLLNWLNSKGYKISEVAKDLLDWYIDKGWYFTAIKINGDKLASKFQKKVGKTIYYSANNKDEMHPVKLSFFSDSIVYPIKISQKSTLSAKKFNEEIVDKYPDYSSATSSDILIIRSWMDNSMEEIWQSIKESKDYDDNFKFNNSIKTAESCGGYYYVENGITKCIGDKKIIKNSLSKYDYDKYKERWWKKNNSEAWIESEVKKILYEYDADSIKKFCSCLSNRFLMDLGDGLTERNFSDKLKMFFLKSIDEHFHGYINYYDNGCDYFHGIDDQRYNKVIDEIYYDYPYYTEDGIKHDIEVAMIRSLPDDLQKIINTNAKTNEVLIYVLAANKMKAPGFKTEFSKLIDKKSLSGLNELKKTAKNMLYLTKLRRIFSYSEMDEDVYFLPDEDKSDIRMTVEIRSDGMIDNRSNYSAETKPLSVSYEKEGYDKLIKRDSIGMNKSFLNQNLKIYSLYLLSIFVLIVFAWILIRIM